MFGMLISLRSFSERLSTKEGHQSVLHFKTSAYKMNYMESLTGLKIVLLTDPNALLVPDLLRRIYQVYVDTISNNILINPADELKSELFASRLDKEVTSHSSYL